VGIGRGDDLLAADVPDNDLDIQDIRCRSRDSRPIHPLSPLALDHGPPVAAAWL
jgi:hypothetical protein